MPNSKAALLAAQAAVSIILFLAIFLGGSLAIVGLLDLRSNLFFGFIFFVVGAYAVYSAINRARRMTETVLGFNQSLSRIHSEKKAQTFLFAVLGAACTALYLALGFVNFVLAMIVLWPIMLTEVFAYKVGIFIEYELKLGALSNISSIIRVIPEAYYLWILSEAILKVYHRAQKKT